jgi:hypothetical protein
MQPRVGQRAQPSSTLCRRFSCRNLQRSLLRHGIHTLILFYTATLCFESLSFTPVFLVTVPELLECRPARYFYSMVRSQDIATDLHLRHSSPSLILCFKTAMLEPELELEHNRIQTHNVSCQLNLLLVNCKGRKNVDHNNGVLAFDINDSRHHSRPAIPVRPAGDHLTRPHTVEILNTRC